MKLPLPFPLHGVNLDAPVGAQPPGTVRVAKNVGGQDPITLRSRGSQRHGHRRLLDDPLGGGPVVDLNQVVTDVPRIIWRQCGESDDAPIVTQWSVAPERGRIINAIEVDLNGAPYLQNVQGGISVLNQTTGEVVRSFTVMGEVDEEPDVLPFTMVDRIKFDEEGALIVVQQRSMGADTEVGTRIHRYKRAGAEKNYYSLHWTIDLVDRTALDFDTRFGLVAIVARTFAGGRRLLRYGGAIGVEPDLQWDIDTDASATRCAIGRQGAIYVGVVPGVGAPSLRKYSAGGEDAWSGALTIGGVGSALVLTAEDDIITVGPKDGDDIVARKVIDLGTTFSTDEHTRASATLTLTLPGTDGQTFTLGFQTYTLRATPAAADEVAIGVDATATATNLLNAINHVSPASGYHEDTRLNQEAFAEIAGAVLTLRAKVGGLVGNEVSIETTISGATLSVTNGHLEGGLDDGDGAWSYGDAEDIYGDAVTRPVSHLALDSNGDVYIPIKKAGLAKQVMKLSGEHGGLLWSYRYSSIGQGQLSFAVGVPPVDPVYHTRTITGPRHIYVGTSVGTPVSTNPTVYRLLTVEARHDQGASAITRKNVYVGVSNGNIITFERDGDPTVPEGGSNALEPTSPYIASAVGFGRIYYIDGDAYRVYDPEGFDETPRRDRVSEWKASGVGRIPEHARLICSWGSRLVLARFTDDPQNWAMSKRGDPDDWEFFPTVPTAGDAVAGNDSRQGVCPDIVNALIPYSDDILIFGCDHSIHRMTGDPGAGGYFDLVSDTTGIAFGAPWCKDPSGVLYFFGSRGGIYRMVPGSVPENITRSSIESALLAVNLADFRARMVWDTKLDCLRLYFVSVDASGSKVQHWTWERGRAWWPVEFFSADHEPTSVAVFDGDDPDDRLVVLGCADGRVRYIDPLALNDDNVRIESLVEIGPLAPDSTLGALMFKSLQAWLAFDQGGCHYEWLVGTSAEELEVRAKGHFWPGANPMSKARARGNFVALRLFNASQSDRWAIESLTIEAVPMGRKRAERRA